jgi:hypothetical protein
MQVKLWDIANNQPLCGASINQVICLFILQKDLRQLCCSPTFLLLQGAEFTVSFPNDSPFFANMWRIKRQNRRSSLLPSSGGVQISRLHGCSAESSAPSPTPGEAADSHPRINKVVCVSVTWFSLSYTCAHTQSDPLFCGLVHQRN